MKGKFHLIRCVKPGSIAQEAGIEEGDSLLSVDGKEIRDVFDYRMLTANERLLLEVRKKDGEIWKIDIEKDEYEDLGMEFDNDMMDNVMKCRNRCIFCFIDQLPRGMRKTLYLKDDDFRLSFLHGNYVTLTNTDKREIQRIIDSRMSPVNVSVHATNPVLRVSMLRNRNAGDVLEKINMLTDGGITINCQIVLCRGINDGKELDRSLGDLASLYPRMNSVSVVPVGITKYRDGLPHLEPYDREASEAVIRQVEAWQAKFLKKYGSRVVYLADEFYITAGREIPGCESYEGFPQIENGVGLVSLFMNEFDEYLCRCARYSAHLLKSRNISIATGVLMYNYMKNMAERLENYFKGLRINVYEIKNNFFGKNVTVTGLLTGSDIASQLAGRELGEELLISRSVLKADEDVFLDGFSVEMLKECLKTRITVVENSGRDFIDRVLGTVPPVRG